MMARKVVMTMTIMTAPTLPPHRQAQRMTKMEYVQHPHASMTFASHPLNVK
jgi:hypothetical protein